MSLRMVVVTCFAHLLAMTVFRCTRQMYGPATASAHWNAVQQIGAFHAIV